MILEIIILSLTVYIALGAFTAALVLWNDDSYTYTIALFLFLWPIIAFINIRYSSKKLFKELKKYIKEVKDETNRK